MGQIIKLQTYDELVVNIKNENLIKEHILKETPQGFSEKVEDLVWMKDISYFEAIQTLQEELNYEPEYVSKLLTPNLYTKLSEELEKLSLVKKTKTSRLDI